MRKIILFFILLISVSVPNLIAQYRILLLGDSITNGLFSSNNGFRSYLYQSLEQLNFPFEFVGSVGNDPYYCFCENGAHIEWFVPSPVGTGQLDVTQEMNITQPNLVMIHLGTNDVDWGTLTPYSDDGGLTLSTETTTGMLANLLAYLLQWKSGVRGSFLEKIFVCKIIEKTGYGLRVVEYNSGIQAIFEDSEAGNIPSIPPGSIQIVDQYSDFNPSTMFAADGIHPNDLGYQNIASNYYDGLRTLPLHLSVVTDDTLSGISGYNLLNPLQVRVIDDFGSGIGNFEVEFSVVEGGATLIGNTTVSSDLQGFIDVDVYLDEVGTSIIRATGNLLITDTLDFVVECIEGIHVSGEVTYQKHQTPIPGVDFKWVENQDVNTSSNETGNYMLTSLLPGADVTLHITKPQWSDVGPWVILSYDAAMVAQYTVGRRPLTGDAFNAADVNQDGEVTIWDAAIIARNVAGLSDLENSKLGSWVFKPDSVFITPIIENVEDQDITGYVLGDVHTLWNSSGGLQKKQTDFQTIPCTAFHQDSTVTFPLQIKGKDICSFDYILTINDPDFEFKSVLISGSVPDYHIQSSLIDEGVIRIGGYSNQSLEDQTLIMNILLQCESTISQTSIDLEPLYLNDQLMEPIHVDYEANSESHREAFALFPNYPNPFNHMTMIRFYLPQTQKVKLTIYNQLGQEVIQLFHKEFHAGQQQIQWNGRDKMGRVVSSGIYFYRLQSETSHYVRKMQIIQ